MTSITSSKIQRVRIIVVILILIIIALIHVFRIGSYLSEDLKILYYSYASDILIPFGLYFLISLNEVKYGFLRSWQTKAVIIFGFCFGAETLQAFGFYFLGQTFDFLDYFAYGFGVSSAVVVDQLIFKKFIPFWDYFAVRKNKN